MSNYRLESTNNDEAEPTGFVAEPTGYDVPSDDVDAVDVRERFIWPPRPLVDLQPRPGPMHPGAAPNRSLHEQDHRPATIGEQPGSDARHEARTNINDRGPRNSNTADREPARNIGSVSWWNVIERGWLGVKGLPLDHRLELAGWSPASPGEYCRGCGRSIGGSFGDPSGSVSRCSWCVSDRPPWDAVVRLSEYSEPMAGVVRDIKFTRWRSLGVHAGRLLGESIRGALPTAGLAGPMSAPLLVPVPISYRRRVARGIDHTSAIAIGVRQVLGGEVCRLLGRRHRPSQTSLPAEQRRRNLAGAIWAKRPPPIGRTVVLIDDVMTTGATMRAACRAIREAERSVTRGRGFSGKTSVRPGRSGGVGQHEEGCGIVVAVLCVAEVQEGMGKLEYIEPETGMLL